MMRRWLCLGVAGAMCWGAGMSAQVKVWEGTLTMAASDEAPADVNPPLDGAGVASTYPYAGRTAVLDTESTHAWRALFLENEYLKCTILPDLGGHIYTCVDKINGVPMFYANPTFKRALVALRGAWSAYGDEFNFPVSHSWVSVSPVDWSAATAADGSASVTVGNRDRVYGMDWQVQIVLRPKSTLVEENVTLSNPGDRRHRFYWWNNGAVQVWDDSKAWYPMQYTKEGAAVDTWPVNHAGKDYSVAGNQTDGVVAQFAYRTQESYMGMYHPHTDAGIVHYAEHSQAAGMKIWSWGATKDGMHWREILSDNKSEYMEVQSGLYADQQTFAFLDPEHATRFTEYWMPVRGIGRITRATPGGVLAMSRDPQAATVLVLGFNSNGVVEGATISLLDGEKSVYGETVTLDPAKTWKHRAENLAADRKYTLVVKDAQGKVLLEHTEDKYDFLPLPAAQPAVKNEANRQGGESWFVVSGLRQEVGGHDLTALEAYTEGLKRFKTSESLLKAAGRLEVHLMRYKDAAAHLGDAEKRGGGGDAELHYYRGLALHGLGQEDEARKEFEAAMGVGDFRIAAGLQVAELEARAGGAGAALKRLDEVCPATEGTARCVEERVALKRAAGDAAGAKTMAAAGLVSFPTSAFLRVEMERMGAADDGVDALLGADSQKVLNVAWEYARLGMVADAVGVLAKEYPRATVDTMDRGALMPGEDPLVAYARGYFRQKMGQSGVEDFKAGAKVRGRYVFPNDAESAEVLQAALKANPGDAGAEYLLGLLWYSRGLTDQAIDAWKRAYAAEPGIPGLTVTLGYALLKVRKQPAEAVPVLEKGLQVDAGNPKVYLELDDAMQALRKPVSERVAMLQGFPAAAFMPADLLTRLVEDLRAVGKNAEADKVLAAHYVVAKEH